MKTIIVVHYLLYALQTAEADITAEGLERGEVSFQCSHVNARGNNKYLCKNPCGSSEDILLSVRSGGRSESERIFLKDWGNGVFTVIFSDLQLTDSGKYWCGVERMGFDTFTAVHLTVKEGVFSETTTDLPYPSPTWTDLNDHSSRQQTLKTTTNTPTSITTAPNITNGGGQSNSTGTVLLTTLGAVVVFTLLVLAAWLGRQRKSLKPQPQVCTNSTAPVRANNRKDEHSMKKPTSQLPVLMSHLLPSASSTRNQSLKTDGQQEQVDLERNNISEEIQGMIKLPVNLSCIREPAKDPPTAAKSSDPLHIYENICCSRNAAHTATNCREENNTCSGIYINPLPSKRSAHADQGSLKNTANQNMSTRDVMGNPTESCVSKVSVCDSIETRPRSLWFGLDLSGTI